MTISAGKKRPEHKADNSHLSSAEIKQVRYPNGHTHPRVHGKVKVWLTLEKASALDGNGWSTPRSGLFTRGKQTCSWSGA